MFELNTYRWFKRIVCRPPDPWLGIVIGPGSSMDFMYIGSCTVWIKLEKVDKSTRESYLASIWRQPSQHSAAIIIGIILDSLLLVEALRSRCSWLVGRLRRCVFLLDEVRVISSDHCIWSDLGSGSTFIAMCNRNVLHRILHQLWLPKELWYQALCSPGRFTILDPAPNIMSAAFLLSPQSLCTGDW